MNRKSGHDLESKITKKDSRGTTWSRTLTKTGIRKRANAIRPNEIKSFKG
jgi:hypothetical protein